MSPHKTNSRQNRGGFTLIELLVTVGIIGLLVALLLPALGSALSNANTAKVSAEISSLETALANFQSEFGHFPPSRIRIYEAATGDPSWSQDSTNDAERIRSRQIITELWPDYDFTTTVDINSDGDLTDAFELSGAECLVFFLGGVPNAAQMTSSPQIYYPIGFSKNPTSPFTQAGNTRVGPFFEFQVDRINDSDGDQIFEYYDPFEVNLNPYCYLSSYDGRGYDADDLAAGFAPTPNLYLEVPGKAFKPKGYQLISPGRDGLYGRGGVHDPTGKQSSLSSAVKIGPDDEDNVTNFSSGTLK